MSNDDDSIYIKPKNLNQPQNILNFKNSPCQYPNCSCHQFRLNPKVEETCFCKHKQQSHYIQTLKKDNREEIELTSIPCFYETEIANLLIEENKGIEGAFLIRQSNLREGATILLNDCSQKKHVKIHIANDKTTKNWTIDGYGFPFRNIGELLSHLMNISLLEVAIVPNNYFKEQIDLKFNSNPSPIEEWFHLLSLNAPEGLKKWDQMTKSKTRLEILAILETHESRLGNTPLHFAVKNLSFTLIKKFLDAGANKNAMNYIGETPLTIADSSVNLDLRKLFNLPELRRETNFNIQQLFSHFKNQLNLTPKKPQAIFGNSIENILSQQDKKQVPEFLSYCIEVIKKELPAGVFRAETSVVWLQKARKMINEGYDFREQFPDLGGLEAAHLVKNFLRSLKPPLFEVKNMASFITRLKNVDEHSFVELISFTISQLPVPNQVVLIPLLDLLSFVAKNEKKTLMSASNLGITPGRVFFEEERPMEKPSNDTSEMVQRILLNWEKISDKLEKHM